MSTQTLPKILVLCTGNSCRSQMMHGFLKKITSVSLGYFLKKIWYPFLTKKKNVWSKNHQKRQKINFLQFANSTNTSIRRGCVGKVTVTRFFFCSLPRLFYFCGCTEARFLGSEVNKGGASCKNYLLYIFNISCNVCHPNMSITCGHAQHVLTKYDGGTNILT